MATRAPLFPTKSPAYPASAVYPANPANPTVTLIPGVPATPITLTITQKAKLAVYFKDRGGKDSKVDSSPVWTTSRPEVATVAASADGLTATVVAVKAGSTTIQCSTAIRNGRVLATIEVSVVGKDPVSGFISAGPIEEQ